MKIHPIETVKESATIHIFGEKMYREMEQGITEHHAMLLEAIFHVPRKFWLKLQKNYEKKGQSND